MSKGSAVEGLVNFGGRLLLVVVVGGGWWWLTVVAMVDQDHALIPCCFRK